MLEPLRLAIGFLTRIPLAPAQWRADAWRASLTWYPVVGLLVGLLLAAVAWLCSLAFPASVTGALVVMAACLLTGGLHIDGLADSADAWMGAPGDRERSLRILKDVHAGSAAVWTVAMLLILKSLAAAESLQSGLWALLLAPAVARTMPPLLFACTPYARPEGGLGSHLDAQGPGLPCIVAVIVVIMLTLLTAGVMHGLLLLASQGLLFVLCRAAMMRRLGGTTGDTAGALVELSEVTWLLVWVAG